LSRARVRWQEEARPSYAALAEHWQNVDLSSTPSERLLAGAGELVRAAADHYLTIQSGILPAAYMSELLFTQVYERLIRRRGDPAALTFMLGVDSAPILAEKSLYDLAIFARSQPELAAHLERTPSADLVRDLQRSDVVASWTEFRERFLSDLMTYGHAIYDLDFAKPLPVDEPAPLIEALKYFLSGQSMNPHDRQKQATTARERATRTIDARLRGPRRRWFRDTLAFAQRFAPLREDALADVGLGWPVLRRLLAELGRRLVAAGLIDTPDDIYWLRLPELRAALANAVTDVHPLIARRRAQWANERRAVPAALPVKGGAVFLGFDCVFR
jgi:pyruvate,water dikinase